MIASFHDLAKVELNEAARYYEAESPGLGTAFLVEAERTVAAILEHPASSPVVGRSVRRRLLGRFPYGLVYRVRGEQLRVLAVMNLRRRPAYWVGRM
jgi:plasmid stabilization system protein ParE